MKTVILDVATRQEAGKDFIRAWEIGKPQRNARISFETPELLWKVLTAQRWELLKSLCGVGPISIREAARRVGRDVKTVHGDVTALLDAGVLPIEPPAVQSSSHTKQSKLSSCSKPRPNPSLKRSANGRPPGPGWWYAVHFHQPGPGVLPLSPA